MDWMSAKAHAPNSLKDKSWCNDAEGDDVYMYQVKSMRILMTWKGDDIDLVTYGAKTEFSTSTLDDR